MNDSPRLRRLRLDNGRLDARFRNWPTIRITGMAGSPPEQYQVTYNVRGLLSTPTGQIEERTQHVMEINLSLGYPRRAPQCKMLTPIFHPNFDEVSVCIGDFWAASEGLDDLIVRVGRMIAYQEYNTKSPLNGLAAKWAGQNAHLLPVDSVELAPPSDHQPQEQAEKLVVKLDGEASEPDLVSPPQAAASVTRTDQSPFQAPLKPIAPLHAAAPAINNPAPLAEFGVPRLDFGMIAVAIFRGRTTVGRAADNNIQLSHSSISKHHSEVVRIDERFVVRDLKSTNGTRLNGKRISEAEIAAGDKICFGDLEAVFLD